MPQPNANVTHGGTFTVNTADAVAIRDALHGELDRLGVQDRERTPVEVVGSLLVEDSLKFATAQTCLPDGTMLNVRRLQRLGMFAALFTFTRLETAHHAICSKCRDAFEAESHGAMAPIKWTPPAKPQAAAAPREASATELLIVLLVGISSVFTPTLASIEAAVLGTAALAVLLARLWVWAERRRSASAQKSAPAAC